MSDHQQLVQQVFDRAAVSLAQGSPPRAVVADLVERGVPEDAAQHIVGEANNYKKREFRKAGLEALAGGVGLIVLGGIITGATYSAASPGGTYLVTSGLFLVGGLAVVRGLWRMMIG